MDENRSVASSDNQVIEILFQFLNTIPLDMPIHLGYLPEDTDALAMRFLSEECKKKYNILGEYEALLSFAVYGSTQNRDAKSIFKVMKLLNTIASKFEEEMQAGFPNLILGEFIPLKLEMLKTPGIEESTLHTAVCKAQYQLTYKKQSIKK